METQNSYSQGYAKKNVAYNQRETSKRAELSPYSAAAKYKIFPDHTIFLHNEGFLQGCFDGFLKSKKNRLLIPKREIELLQGLKDAGDEAALYGWRVFESYVSNDLAVIIENAQCATTYELFESMINRVGHQFNLLFLTQDKALINKIYRLRHNAERGSLKLIRGAMISEAGTLYEPFWSEVACSVEQHIVH